MLPEMVNEGSVALVQDLHPLRQRSEALREVGVPLLQQTVQLAPVLLLLAGSERHGDGELGGEFMTGIFVCVEILSPSLTGTCGLFGKLSSVMQSVVCSPKLVASRR